jgi:hypothetical protein
VFEGLGPQVGARLFSSPFDDVKENMLAFKDQCFKPLTAHASKPANHLRPSFASAEELFQRF